MFCMILFGIILEILKGRRGIVTWQGVTYAEADVAADETD